MRCDIMTSHSFHNKHFINSEPTRIYTKFVTLHIACVAGSVPHDVAATEPYTCFCLLVLSVKNQNMSLFMEIIISYFKNE